MSKLEKISDFLNDLKFPLAMLIALTASNLMRYYEPKPTVYEPRPLDTYYMKEGAACIERFLGPGRHVVNSIGINVTQAGRYEFCKKVVEP